MTVRLAALCLFVAGCTVPPRDPFVTAERALDGSDLLTALVSYDMVPVAHPRYPEARAAAAGVERRMRRGHELLLEGLLLRSEWRDREALLALRRAHAIWPNLPGVAELISATEHRAGLFGAEASPVAEPEALAAPRAGTAAVPLVRDDRGPADTVPVAQPEQSPPPEISAPPVLPPEPAVTPPAMRAERSLGEDPIALGLVAVETKLWRGELEAAVGDLLELAARFPSDPRVQVRLARVLHQRALLRYGQGALSAAIADWERLLLLEPANTLARTLLLSARIEAAATASPGR